MNDFEKYLKKNKHKLEPDHIDEKVWLTVENQLLKDSNHRFGYYLKVFLIGIILLVGSYTVYQYFKGEKPHDEERIIAELGLKEYNFSQKIDTKKQQLAKATVPSDKAENLEVLLHQLKFMDGQFQDYRQYIEQNGYQEFIGEQILNFYKSKIELLDKIQEEIEKINYYEKKQPSNSRKVGIQI